MIFEPLVGLEPTTDGLQNRCSTAELKWQMYRIQKYAIFSKMSSIFPLGTTRKNFFLET